VIDRCQGGANDRNSAVPSPIGWLPAPGAIDANGLGLSPETLRELTSINPAEWLKEMEEVETFFGKFGKRLPQALLDQAARTKAELQRA
jgi:phosphoenolpyruvate carboxykinase (GTP)